MGQRLFYVHTVPSLVGTFNGLSRELLPPGVEVFHIADEMMLKLALARGGLFPLIYRRLAEHVAAAEAAGADAVQVTCSSISPCVDVARPLVGIPVLKVDEPMADRAVALGGRIGVAATLPTTLMPTSELVRDRARAVGASVEVEADLCAGAFDALSAGDMEAHDRIVREALQGLMARNQVVVLAQASMARVADTIPEVERIRPILSSPRLAVERARDVLLEAADGRA